MDNKGLLRGFTICIDAGHGGKDSGAYDPVNEKEGDKLDTKEKDVTLAISLTLQKKLLSKGATVILTRSKDFYPTLAQRCQVANEGEADIFISIHTNAGNSKAKGIETLVSPDSVRGRKLAQIVQEELILSTKAVNRGIKFRDDLYVLNGTKMPSVLVELGFITNSTEEVLLNNKKYQDRVVEAIYKALVRYKAGE